MGEWILIVVGAVLVLLLAWYAGFTRYNRHRGSAVLLWVQAACLGRGRIAHSRWQDSTSQLKATLRLSSRWFEEAHLTVHLLPRPVPGRWLVSRWRKQRETLTFEADMGFAPGFSMDVIRRRWSGHAGKKARSGTGTRTWNLFRPGPIVLTTREDWPAELSAVVNAFATWRDKDFISVRFSPTSPHFTATVALESLSDQNAAGLLGLFRELAASASSARQQ